MRHEPKKLMEEILKMSLSSDWDEAKEEWRLVYISVLDEDLRTCLCGHSPIKEVCEIHNTKTNKVAEVGNVCVNHFLGIDTTSFMPALRRITKDPTKSMGEALFYFAVCKMRLSGWDQKFLQNTMSNRASSLSFKQESSRVRINKKVIRELSIST
jgi:hypothetical protein|tara:strand:- start:5760 stop:6224 length:465 start_codon:yes stop_codon:yes gene_type:complete